MMANLIEKWLQINQSNNFDGFCCIRRNCWLANLLNIHYSIITSTPNAFFSKNVFSICLSRNSCKKGYVSLSYAKLSWLLLSILYLSLQHLHILNFSTTPSDYMFYLYLCLRQSHTSYYYVFGFFFSQLLRLSFHKNSPIQSFMKLHFFI